MEINRNSSLTNLADAMAGSWNRTITENALILEHGDMTIVRIDVTKAGTILLPVVPSRNTPYVLYSKDSMKGGVLLPDQRAVNCNTTGVLEYTLLHVRKIS